MDVGLWGEKRKESPLASLALDERPLHEATPLSPCPELKVAECMAGGSRGSRRGKEEEKEREMKEQVEGKLTRPRVAVLL